jgi:glyoxylate/hydroxypyruvate reductase
MPKLVIYTPDPHEFERHIAPAAPDLEVVVAPQDDPAAAIALARDADYLLAWRTPPELLRACQRLTWVQSFGAGVDHLLSAPIPPQVAITRVVDVFGPYMAEFVVGYCYAAMLDVRRILEQQGRREWAPFRANLLRGKTAVVVGLGSIGREVARLFTASGVRVLGVSRSGRPVDGAAETHPTADLDRVLPQADFLAIVAPLTAETHGLIDARRLALLPPGAWLINVARGALVVEADLLTALRSGRLGGAVLDVFDQEPLPPDHPFWALPNVIVTPHISGPDEWELISQQFIENYERLKAGQPLLRTVDRARGY